MKEGPFDYEGPSFFRKTDPSSLRLVVTGANGAGKTWLARRLSQAFGVPLISNDALALASGWQHLPREEVRKIRDALISDSAWVLEGGPSILTELVLARASAVIWLDPPRGRRVYRIILRSLRYLGRVRPEHPPGNREWPGRRQWHFARRAWSADAAFREAISAALKNSGLPVVQLQTNAETSAFLQAARQCAEPLQ